FRSFFWRSFIPFRECIFRSFDRIIHIVMAAFWNFCDDFLSRRVLHFAEFAGIGILPFAVVVDLILFHKNLLLNLYNKSRQNFDSVFLFIVPFVCFKKTYIHAYSIYIQGKVGLSSYWKSGTGQKKKKG